MSAGYLRKCSTKKPHPTRELAESHRESMIAQRLWTRNKSNVYRCNVCGHWHDGRKGVRNRGTR